MLYQKLTISRSIKRQAVMTENREQYSFSNIIYIKFQNCCFFTMMSTLNKVLLTVDRSIERCLPGSSFFRHNCILGICNFTKDSPLYMYFPSFLLRFQICSNLWRVFRHITNFCFPKNLSVAPANHCKVLKLFISK